MQVVLLVLFSFCCCLLFVVVICCNMKYLITTWNTYIFIFTGKNIRPMVLVNYLCHTNDLKEAITKEWPECKIKKSAPLNTELNLSKSEVLNTILTLTVLTLDKSFDTWHLRRLTCSSAVLIGMQRILLVWKPVSMSTLGLKRGSYRIMKKTNNKSLQPYTTWCMTFIHPKLQTISRMCCMLQDQTTLSEAQSRKHHWTIHTNIY